jgi:predicted TIM-barrel fold metal-dependent hydrolase
VRIKISDLVAYDHDWTLDSLRAVLFTCLDCFGAARAMVGSDFPVAKLHATCDEIFDAFETLTAELSADEQHALFFDTAQQTYRIDHPAQ